MAQEGTIEPLKGGPEDGSNKTFRGEDGPPDRETSKRLAQQGQWQTPPLPAFAASAASGTNLPSTPDEYARMLQEAYKRGAEAGARAQKPAPPAQGRPAMAPPAAAVPYNSMPAPGAGMAGPPNARVHAPPAHYHQRPRGAPSKLASSHSKSMPDMSAYHGAFAPGDDEEDKRKKRLARNRASARLRRLKKKNLVDSYEGEVGILESALAKLRAHRWGSGAENHDALIEALSMERGQHPLTPEQRRELVLSIIAQQREQVGNLLECQMENWLLGALADPETLGESANASDDQELAELTSELQSVLNLTPDQMSQIKESSQGCQHEVQDLFTVDQCLQSIHENQWLLDEGVDEIAGQFTSILNPAQLSKFLLWADHNADQIEKLDYVNVLPGVANGPVFEFGVDEGMADGD